jgi:uncharacterized protein (DUF952 family)
VRIYHIARRADWDEARRTGTYTVSTLGRTLAEEGFIHASTRDQVGPVFTAFYRGVREPLVLLTIDPERLESPWREDLVGDETYPHIYGPLNPSAVTAAVPLNRRGGTESFTTLFVKEMAMRMFLALGVMVCAGVGAKVWSDRPLIGALIGAVLAGAVLLAGWIASRRGLGRGR